MGTGANGHLRKMGAILRVTDHCKWVFGALNWAKRKLLRLMGVGTSRHWGQMSTWVKWAPGKMSNRANGYLQQMGTLELNGHLGTDGHWSKLALGKNGHLGQMGTRKNEHHQGKSAIGANGHFGANGQFGTDGHWDKWALGENDHQEKRAPEEISIGQLGQMSTLGEWVFGTMGMWGLGQMDVWEIEHFEAIK